MSNLQALNSEALLCKITISGAKTKSCLVQKQCVQNVLTITICFRCKIYFMLFFFVVYANHENNFTMKIYSISTYSIIHKPHKSQNLGGRGLKPPKSPKCLHHYISYFRLLLFAGMERLYVVTLLLLLATCELSNVECM